MSNDHPFDCGSPDCYPCGVERYYEEKRQQVQRLRARITEVENAMWHLEESSKERKNELLQLKRELRLAEYTGD